MREKKHPKILELNKYADESPDERTLREGKVKCLRRIVDSLLQTGVAGKPWKKLMSRFG